MLLSISRRENKSAKVGAGFTAEQAKTAREITVSKYIEDVEFLILKFNCYCGTIYIVKVYPVYK